MSDEQHDPSLDDETTTDGLEAVDDDDVDEATPTEDAVDILAKLALHEQEMQSLYDFFARTFDESTDFWAALAKEERQHFEWIQSLLRLIGQGRVQTVQPTISSAEIDCSIQEIRNAKQLCLANKLDELQATAIARDREISMEERRFFDVVDLDNDEFAEVGRKLFKATTVHRSRVLDHLRSLGGGTQPYLRATQG